MLRKKKTPFYKKISRKPYEETDEQNNLDIKTRAYQRKQTGLRFDNVRELPKKSPQFMTYNFLVIAHYLNHS